MGTRNHSHILALLIAAGLHLPKGPDVSPPSLLTAASLLRPAGVSTGCFNMGNIRHPSAPLWPPSQSGLGIGDMMEMCHLMNLVAYVYKSSKAFRGHRMPEIHCRQSPSSSRGATLCCDSSAHLEQGGRVTLSQLVNNLSTPWDAKHATPPNKNLSHPPSASEKPTRQVGPRLVLARFLWKQLPRHRDTLEDLPLLAGTTERFECCLKALTLLHDLHESLRITIAHMLLLCVCVCALACMYFFLSYHWIAASTGSLSNVAARARS